MWNTGFMKLTNYCIIQAKHDVSGGCLGSRDGNRTEPEPNTPNSNPILRPFRPNRTNPKSLTTEPEPNRTITTTEPNRTRTFVVRFDSHMEDEEADFLSDYKTKQQLFLRMWQTHVMNWNSICRYLSQTPQLLALYCYEYCKWTSVFSVWHWMSL